MGDTPSTRPVLPGEDIKSVSLREFEQNKEHFAREIAHERELREEITEKLEEARRLNAIEIFRRLDDLNHAHKTAMENWARSLPRELFEQWKEDYDRWSLEVRTQLTLLTPIPAHIQALTTKVETVERDVNQLKTVGSSHVQAVDVRVDALEKQMLTLSGIDGRVNALDNLVSNFRGAAWVLGLMGLSGVLALALGLLRLAGAVQ